MKIEIELQITPEHLHNITKVEDLMTAIAEELRAKEPELYNYIHNLGFFIIWQYHIGMIALMMALDKIGSNPITATR